MRRTSLPTSALFLLAALLLAPAQPRAEDLNPAEVKISTPFYQPAGFTPALGTYVYEVSWQGIPAASATITVDRDGKDLLISAGAKTLRAIDILYKLRYNASARISADKLLPSASVYHKQENKKVRDTEITFLPSGEISTVRRNEKGEVERLQFNPENLTLDPFSASFLARSLDWKLGDTKYFDTYEGKNRYLISLTAVDKVRMQINKQPRDVWVIMPKVKKLGGPINAKKLRQAHIYMTADEAREILEIKSEVFIGSVRTKLVSFIPSRKSGTVAGKPAPEKLALR